MKQKIKRIAVFLLTLLVTFSVCACGIDEEPSDNDQSGSANSNKIQPLEGETPVDLSGYEFTVLDYTDTRWQKESSGTAYGDAWAQMIKEVESLYNCKITVLPTVNANAIHSTVERAAGAGEKCADLIVAPQWEYGYLLQNNLMMDLNKLEVNWDNDWWNQNVRNMASVGGQMLAAGGSFLEDGGSTWALYYNKRIWKECGFEDAYKLVDEGRWTQEKFVEYCRKAVEGSADYGLITADTDFCRAWFQALGGEYYTGRSGNLELGCNNDTAFSIVNTMSEMARKDNVICREWEEENDRQVQFASGKSLFYAYTLGAALQNMEDDWGILPLPKRNEAQADYISCVDHNFPLFGVTTANQNTKEVSVILEALGRHGMALKGIYWDDYNESYWRSEEDARVMAEYIANHGRYDMATMLQTCDAALAAPMNYMYNAIFGTTGDFESPIKAAADVLARKAQEAFAKKEVANTEPQPTQAQKGTYYYPTVKEFWTEFYKQISKEKIGNLKQTDEYVVFSVSEIYVVKLELNENGHIDGVIVTFEQEGLLQTLVDTGNVEKYNGVMAVPITVLLNFQEGTDYKMTDIVTLLSDKVISTSEGIIAAFSLNNCKLGYKATADSITMALSMTN